MWVVPLRDRRPVWGILESLRTSDHASSAPSFEWRMWKALSKEVAMKIYVDGPRAMLDQLPTAGTDVLTRIAEVLTVGERTWT